MDKHQIEMRLRKLLEEARVDFMDVRVGEFHDIEHRGITRLFLRPYCSERIVELEYQHDPSYDFLEYPEPYQDVCLRHEVCEVLVNGCKWRTIKTFRDAEDYFTLAFIEFLVHREFQSRYEEYVPTYCSKWIWEMERYFKGKLNVKAIESDIFEAVYNFVATLVFIPDKLKKKFEEADSIDLYNEMHRIIESFERHYGGNRDKTYEEKLRLLQLLR